MVKTIKKPRKSVKHKVVRRKHTKRKSRKSTKRKSRNLTIMKGGNLSIFESVTYKRGPILISDKYIEYEYPKTNVEENTDQFKDYVTKYMENYIITYRAELVKDDMPKHVIIIINIGKTAHNIYNVMFCKQNIVENADDDSKSYQYEIIYSFIMIKNESLNNRFKYIFGTDNFLLLGKEKGFHYGEQYEKDRQTKLEAKIKTELINGISIETTKVLVKTTTFLGKNQYILEKKPSVTADTGNSDPIPTRDPDVIPNQEPEELTNGETLITFIKHDIDGNIDIEHITKEKQYITISNDWKTKLLKMWNKLKTNTKPENDIKTELLYTYTYPYYLTKVDKPKYIGRYKDIKALISSLAGKGEEKFYHANKIDLQISLSQPITLNFIASEGPKTDAVYFENFWDMIKHENVNFIVNLTGYKEGDKEKCAEYLKYKKIKIVSSENQLSLVNKRETVFEIHDVKYNTHKVQQYHYKQWPDHDVPKNLKDFNTFIIKLLSILKLNIDNNNNPHVKKKKMLIHCSAGVGRTGTVIAILTLILKYDIDKESIDVDKIIIAMREQRNSHMVQNGDQYIFIYNFLIYYYKNKEELSQVQHIEPASPLHPSLNPTVEESTHSMEAFDAYEARTTGGLPPPVPAHINPPTFAEEPVGVQHIAPASAPSNFTRIVRRVKGKAKGKEKKGEVLLLDEEENPIHLKFGSPEYKAAIAAATTLPVQHIAPAPAPRKVKVVKGKATGKGQQGQQLLQGNQYRSVTI